MAGLSGVLDAEEHPAGKRQDLAGGQLRLGKGQAEILVDPHDLAGGAHLRAQERVHPGEAPEGEDRLLHGEIGRLDFFGEAQLLQGVAQHHLGGQLGQGHAGGLADEGHGAGGPGVDLQDVDLVVLDRELDVHQAHHPQLRGQGPGLAS